MDLHELDVEVQDRADRWAAASATWTITRGLTTDKPAIWLRLEVPDGAGEVILWVSGEAEITWLRPLESETRMEHYETTGRLGLSGCLDDLEHHLGLGT